MRSLKHKEAVCQNALMDNEAYERAVQMLAYNVCPTFEGIDKNEVLKVFSEANEKDFLTNLSASVALSSENRVTLKRDNRSDHEDDCRCLFVQYANISDGKTKIELMLIPGTYEAFQCEQPKEIKN